MSEKLKMNAYHYEFHETGVHSVDEIISAVAIAGSIAHDTSSWSDLKSKHCNGSLIDLMQGAANNCAKELQEKDKTIERQEGEIRELVSCLLKMRALADVYHAQARGENDNDIYIYAQAEKLLSRHQKPEDRGE